jgi:mRNA-degrading endonuclease RelE of RelBE toxin-antitoxin system
VQPRRAASREPAPTASTIRPAPPRRLAKSGASPARCVGSYRIIYTVHDDIVLIVAVAIGHPRDVYR